MQQLIFTEEYCKPENLHPFTYTRHIQDIRIGILTIREKWECYLKVASADKWENSFLDSTESIRIEKNIAKGEYLLVHSNVLPTKKVINKIKGLKNGELLTSIKGGVIAYKFSDKEVEGLHKIKINHPVDYKGEIKTLNYPWQIFQMNDWAIREDYKLIVNGRKSNPKQQTFKPM